MRIKDWDSEAGLQGNILDLTADPVTMHRCMFVNDWKDSCSLPEATLPNSLVTLPFYKNNVF